MSDTLLPSVRETYTDERSLVEARGASVRILEEFRTLYTSVLDRIGQDKGVVLGICSPLGGEGKTTVATNVAFAMASDLERRVLLASCAFTVADTRHPEEEGRRGLSDCVTDPEGGLEDYVVQTPLSNLSVLFGGAYPENPSRLVRSERMRQVLAECRSRFDLTVVDLPPVLSTSDAQVMASLMDKILLVVSVGETSVDAVNRAVKVLGEGRLVGIAANRARPELPRWLSRILGGAEWAASS